MPGDPRTTHYATLGVNADATIDEIRVAYRQRAKASHPDAGGDPAEFRRVGDAYQVLSDPERRRAYDDEQGIRRPTYHPHSGGTTPPATGWSAPSGDFSGDVTFPAYLRDITDKPWEPKLEAPEAPESERAVDPTAPARPADVVWWWPDQAVSPPVAAGPLLVAGTATGVVALGALEGHEAWRTTLGRPVRVAPVVLDGVVVAWSDDGTLHGLDLGTGEIRWQQAFGPASAGGLAVGGRVVVAARADARLAGLDPATGKPHWGAKLAAPTSFALGVSADGGVVVAIGAGTTIEAVDTRKGRHRWRIAVRQPVELPPVVHGETVWLAGGGRAGALVRLDLATGAVQGTSDAGAALAGLTVAGGTPGGAEPLLFVTGAGPARLMALDEWGRVHLAVETPDVCPEPAVDDTFAYLADPAGRIITVHRRHERIVDTVSVPFEPVGPPRLIGDRLVLTARDGRLWATTIPRGPDHRS